MLKKREWKEKEAAILGPKMNQSMDSLKKKKKLDGFLIKGITAGTKKKEFLIFREAA